jgi:hypothetical protein
MRTRKVLLAGLLVLAAGLSASTAQASVTYTPIASLGAGQLGAPIGVAVDQSSGNLLVGNLLEPGGVVELRSNGEHLRTFEAGTELFSGTAVDPVNGNVYAVNGLQPEEKISTYDASGRSLSSFSISGSANFLFGLVTVVQIASDSADNVYLPNAPHNEVQELSPGGSVLGAITGAGAEALSAPTGVSVDPAGNVYVADNGNGRLEEFTAGGAFVMAIGTGVDKTTGGEVCTAASGDTCGSSSDGVQAVALDAAGDIFVGENNGAGFHVAFYSPSGERLADFGLGTIGTAEIGGSDTINTLAVGPSGRVYVTDGANDVVWVFAQQHEPAVLRQSSAAVTQTAAEVSATIDPGYASTVYRFEYGTSAAYGASVPAPDAALGSEGPSAVGQRLTGLQPGTTYHYRVVVVNAFGQVAGDDETFTTLPPQPPVVGTGQAAALAQNAATLTGTVDTRGFETTYEFDMGVDTSYGTRIFGDAGAQAGAATFTAPLEGLAAATTYHYRIVATNQFGTSYGADQAFTTASFPTAALVAPVAQALVPAPLLASEPPAGSRARHAKTKASASLSPVSHTSARKGRRLRHGRHKRAGGHVHGANRGGSK